MQAEFTRQAEVEIAGAHHGVHDAETDSPTSDSTSDISKIDEVPAGDSPDGAGVQVEGVRDEL